MYFYNVRFIDQVGPTKFFSMVQFNFGKDSEPRLVAALAKAAELVASGKEDVKVWQVLPGTNTETLVKQF